MSALNLNGLRLPQKAKFWKKRSITITEYDPTYRVIYLGNVLTGWAKGDGCVDKPLATLWRNHSHSDKMDIVMKVTISPCGLKAVTSEHGLTEYWAHRITYCDSDPSYPKIFCWVYRHEGRKSKQEMRCHAVLCSSSNKAITMASKLKDRISQALLDFKKEKISRQNARLCLANSAYENPSLPFRKILLQIGGSNYRPPIERCKSYPKLKAIEEDLNEDNDIEIIAPYVDEESFLDDDSSEDDEVTNYLEEFSSSPDSNVFSNRSLSSSGELKGNKSDSADNISDESGYSEEKSHKSKSDNDDDDDDNTTYKEDNDRSRSNSDHDSTKRSTKKKVINIYFEKTLTINQMVPEFCIDI